MSKDNQTYSCKCSELCIDSHVIIQGRPCKIVAIDKSDLKKIHIVALDCFTTEKFEIVRSSNTSIKCFNLRRNNYLLSGVYGEFLMLMLMPFKGFHKNDVKIPKGKLGSEIIEAFESSDEFLHITTIAALGCEEVIEYKSTLVV